MTQITLSKTQRVIFNSHNYIPIAYIIWDKLKFLGYYTTLNYPMQIIIKELKEVKQ